ncbi:amino acid adenylation domain-containing protein [Pseudoalteromonas arctica]|uniref:Amino acid adenylation domain-containing protein n=1 Tax=Pseudoalteromonas arctica TaxID=394751 RepID=A0A7Y0DQ75_9GAMM|nr:amino acid adenylation domain-containing protein [Pseudoalteromonas arctica]NMM39604.1 amino acid adenylation domain-containing protein [Pseudoalteromonas arctica]
MRIVDSQPLNPLQRAYLLGRNTQIPLGGVAMHDFREFYCHFNACELETAVSQLAEKYSVMRTLINEHDLKQEILADVILNIEIVDLRECEQQSVQHELNHLREKYSHSVLPLERPLWCMRLVLLPKNMNHDDKHALLFTSFDGLIVDGYAVAILLSELFNGKATHQVMSQRQTPPSYFTNNSIDKAYWQDKLANVDSITTLPWKRDLETIFSPHYVRQGIIIPKRLWQAIAAMGAKHQLLPNSVLSAALLEVVALWANEHYLLFSMPISNSILHQQLGNHSSFIAVEYRANTEVSFIEKAQTLQKNVLNAMAHTTFSGIELGKLLVKKTAKMITLPVAVTNGLSWGASEYEHVDYISGVTQTPQLALDIRISQTAKNDIAIDFDYAEQALPALVISEMLSTVEQYLLAMSSLSDLQSVAPPDLCTQVTAKASGLPEGEPGSEYVAEAIVDNYLEQIKEHLYGNSNNNTALIYAEQKISYATLGKQVAKIINQLSALNINKGDVVAICLPKSPEHIAVTLACSLSNIIWLPIDMGSPIQRIQFMLANCQADLAIIDKALDYDGINTINIDQILDNPEVSETLECQPLFDAEPGYYLYTSGSTGTPKCVVMNHLATANVVAVTNQTWQLTKADVLFAVTPFHHDMSIYELFGAMSLGASLVVPTPEQTKSAMDWSSLIAQHQVSVWSSVPAIVDMLLACAQPQQLLSLKLVSQGGDYVKPSIIEKLRQYVPQARLFSIGGPTETTIWSIWHEISPFDKDIIPYGMALKNNRYYILNESDQHCPNFVIGTICMSGVNLANGYLKAGEINQHDFAMITNPEGETVRVFKTSDRGYFRDDGKIIFSGRKEGYLKIRGVRIASAEIELSLSKHPSVRDAIALACVNPQYASSELVAVYVTENNQPVSTNSLRQFLQSKLPNSHIPSRWLQLERMPLTGNRKIDRKQLKVLAEQRIYQNYTDSNC